MAVITPRGMARHEDKIVTASEAVISGAMPNAGWAVSVGYQYWPKMKSVTLATLKRGRPSMNR